MLSKTVFRYFLDGVGAISVLMFLGGVNGSVWFLTLGLFALFLGITDFG